MMLEQIRHWLFALLAVVMALSIFYALVPKGTIRIVMRFTGGFVLILALLQPLSALDLANWRVEYDVLSDSINEQIGDYQQDQSEQMQSIIQQQTAAYIQDKGKELGLTCQPIVDTEEKDGVPYPIAVTMDIPKNEALSEIIAKDLGIPENAQHWLER